jgi:ribosome maturation factor RimP
MGTVENVERVVAPIVAAAGLELVDVETRPGCIKVTIDRSEGVDLEDISAATSAISRALDHEDAVPGGRYELEVSSPGLERRLRRPEHFQRFVGSQISVRTRPGIEGDRRFDGLLESADGSGIVVGLSSPPGGSRHLDYPDLERAHTIFDWKAALAGTSAPSARAERRENRKAGTGHEARAVDRPGRGTPKRPADADREMTETR